MNYDEREAQRTDDLLDSTLGEDVLFIELDYPDGLACDENPIMDIENPVMDVENPLMGMKRFEYEGFEG